jgi:hypothetical protein
MGMLPKYTPRPERVLSPGQTENFERLVAWLTARPPGSGFGREIQVEQNFYGSMLPNPEQQAQMKRDLALALSGA